MPRPRTGNSEMLRVLISPTEMQTLQAMAAARNTTVSDLIRQRVRALIRKHNEQQTEQSTTTASSAA